MNSRSIRPNRRPVKVISKKEKDKTDKEKKEKEKKEKEKKDKEKKDKEKKEKEKKEKEKEKSGNGIKIVGEEKPDLDEHGNPYPMENEEGGDPICQIGYKIDYQFDPINDPINPPFRCIPALKDINDGMAGKILAMANNPSAGVGILAEDRLPGFGGRRGRKRGRNKTVHGTKRRTRGRGYGYGYGPRRHTRRH